jgi:hypothetical protein
MALLLKILVLQINYSLFRNKIYTCTQRTLKTLCICMQDWHLATLPSYRHHTARYAGNAMTLAYLYYYFFFLLQFSLHIRVKVLFLTEVRRETPTCFLWLESKVYVKNVIYKQKITNYMVVCQKEAPNKRVKWMKSSCYSLNPSQSNLNLSGNILNLSWFFPSDWNFFQFWNVLCLPLDCFWNIYTTKHSSNKTVVKMGRTES